MVPAAQHLGFLNTPPLWYGRQFDVIQFELPHVDMHAFVPTSISGNLRLGHQVEHVFKQLIEHSDGYNIVLHGLPITQNKRTLGEIDFILRSKFNDTFIHVELTYKFYLIDPFLSQPYHRLIGPNKRDTFISKMEKIKNVQLPLIHTESGIHALNTINIDHQKIQHQCCFKAQLFQPIGSDNIDIGSLNSDCLAGYWIRYDDFNKKEFYTSQCYIPTKSEWIIPPHNQVTWKSHGEVIVGLRFMLAKHFAPMIWVKRSNTEIEKLFVVWW